jgi:hypothetical protein
MQFNLAATALGLSPRGRSAMMKEVAAAGALPEDETTKELRKNNF